MNDESILDITEASMQYDIAALSKTVKKYFICYPAELEKFIE